MITENIKTINSAIDEAENVIEAKRGEAVGMMDNYGHVLKAMERAGAAAGEIGKLMKELWSCLKSDDLDAAQIVLDQLEGTTLAAAAEYIRLAAEGRRAARG